MTHRSTDRSFVPALVVLLAVSTLVRGFVAGLTELGNDEVYYRTYALFPDLSHFDHPPMVGWVIQLFTLNLRIDTELFIRLGAVAAGTFNTLLIYLIGREVKDARTGFTAALLFTGSFYGFILTGIFILPDAPQVFFWLSSLLLLLKALPDRDLAPGSRWMFLLAGATMGLALLSKYHAAFLPAGALLYLLFYNRSWFRRWETYAAFAITLACVIPVAAWNIGNDFISFTYHQNRIVITGQGLRWDYFLTEIAGEFFYNNPVNVVLMVSAFGAMIRGRKIMSDSHRRLLLLISLPLLAVFLSFSLFRSTLPHWTGPAYLGFLLFAAAWLNRDTRGKKGIPWPAGVSVVFLFLVTLLAVTQIRYGWIPLAERKMEDPTRDLAGYRQLGEKFRTLSETDRNEGRMQGGAPLLTFRWFPAANFDYYVGKPSGRPVYATGSLDRIHKYHWINKIRGDIRQGSDAYFLAFSDDFEDPFSLYGSRYDSISPPDTLVLTRKFDTIRQVYVYRLHGLKDTWKFR